MKHPRFTLICAALILLAAVAQGWAGGSVELSDLDRLVNQQPALWKAVTDSLDICPHGGGLRLGAMGIPLRGYRVGPYEFQAKVKGAAGDYNLILTIKTDLTFLDAKGNPTNDEMKAVKKEEMLMDISIRPATPPKRDGSFVQSAE